MEPNSCCEERRTRDRFSYGNSCGSYRQVGNALALAVDDGLPDKLYDVGLTLRIRLPNSWPAGVSVTKSNVTIKAQAVDENGSRYVYFDTVPDGQIITITR